MCIYSIVIYRLVVSKGCLKGEPDGVYTMRNAIPSGDQQWLPFNAGGMNESRNEGA